MMKKRVRLFITLCMSLLSFTACQQPNKSCHIHGIMPSDNYDGQWIFLIPTHHEDSIGVDSVQIKGRSFDFVTEKYITAIIRTDYRVRYGLQDLIVVTEPGDVEVTIDSISTGRGTVLNDSLQRWKERTAEYGHRYFLCRRAAFEAKSQNDTAAMILWKTRADSLQEQYIKTTLDLADRVAGTPLGDFLTEHYSPRKH